MSHVCDGGSGALRRFRLIGVGAKAAIIAWEKTHGIMNCHVDSSLEIQAGNPMKDSGSDAAETRPEEIVVNKERFLRWQRLAIDQLGFTLNFILTLTIAALGYIFALLKDKEFIPPRCARYSLILSLLSLVIAATCGMWCTINRLRDVQGTARKLRKSFCAPSSRELRVMGKRTWKLFYTQLWTFSLGIASLAGALLLTYGGKLK